MPFFVEKETLAESFEKFLGGRRLWFSRSPLIPRSWLCMLVTRLLPFLHFSSPLGDLLILQIICIPELLKLFQIYPLKKKFAFLLHSRCSSLPVSSFAVRCCLLCSLFRLICFALFQLMQKAKVRRLIENFPTCAAKVCCLAVFFSRYGVLLGLASFLEYIINCCLVFHFCFPFPYLSYLPVVIRK